MTVIVKPITPVNFPLWVSELVEGKAYLSEHNRPYIGCMLGYVFAFSVDGLDTVKADSQMRFREIKLTCEVEEI